jgi:hypothetical protein
MLALALAKELHGSAPIWVTDTEPGWQLLRPFPPDVFWFRSLRGSPRAATKMCCYTRSSDEPAGRAKGRSTEEGTMNKHSDGSDRNPYCDLCVTADYERRTRMPALHSTRGEQSLFCAGAGTDAVDSGMGYGTGVRLLCRLCVYTI